MASGGTSITGACPSDPSVKCCTKPTCASPPSGNCRWFSDCASSSTPNLCPGPSVFKCCSSNSTGFGGYSEPDFPSVGACKQAAVDVAKTVVAAWKGRVRGVFCTRDCVCGAPSGSDHCCGKATDLMCSDAGGVCSLPSSLYLFHSVLWICTGLIIRMMECNSLRRSNRRMGDEEPRQAGFEICYLGTAVFSLQSFKYSSLFFSDGIQFQSAQADLFGT
jgi:hypothetical protein